ncbi:hypothetical protein [Pedobacter sp. SYP-B3415]|uniref:hypothetical protein n=1 Tax=Pedobacter sp. SYP-B3415 TaxID=2496641 RepID=UPI00101DD201|nr:hypothetical protein [Pedobacter sp. SYP-B3415]
MLTLYKFRAFLGLILCLIAGFCPFLKVPVKGNWNLYQSDPRLFFITYTIIALGVFAVVIRKAGFFRFTAWVHFIWFILAAAAVWFKSNHYFNFGFADRLLAKTIHYQWGWIVWLVGVLFMLFSVQRGRNLGNQVPQNV